MKILVYSLVDLQKSAHNSRLHQFLKYLSKNHEITVICINDCWKAKWDTKTDEYKKDFDFLYDNITIKYITDRDMSPVFQDFFCTGNIKKILQEIHFSEFDLFLNYNGLFTGYVISRIARALGIPIIYDIADDLPEMIATSPQIPSLLRAVGKTVGKIILHRSVSISDKVTITTPVLQSAYQISPQKTELIPNGVDIRLFRKTDIPELIKELKLKNSFTIGHVGVLREWLDFHPLFSAVRKLARSHDIKILMIGGGVGYDDTVNLAKTYNISDNIIFTGTIPYSRIPDYIGCMDVCVVPFKDDSVSQNSLPLKLFEYMSCEKPVISTKVHAIHELFKHDLVFVSGSQEYEDAILRLYQDEMLRKELGSRGRTIIENNYQWDSLSGRLEKIMTGLSERS